MKPYTAHVVADLTRPIIGIDNRSGLEAFDIMADRIKGAAFASPAPTEAVERAVVTWEEIESLIADIDREMTRTKRGYADVRGELLFRCRDALIEGRSA